MKIILTGATGFVGREALTQLIDDPEVESVTCLVRREVAATSPKVKIVVMKDFAEYDPELAKSLATHSGCVWTLGGKASDLGMEKFEKITTTFTLSLINAVSQYLTSPFRLSYLSGMCFGPWQKHLSTDICAPMYESLQFYPVYSKINHFLRRRIFNGLCDFRYSLHYYCSNFLDILFSNRSIPLYAPPWKKDYI